MNTLYYYLSTSWHWSVSGALIALTMFLLLYAGKSFGVSSNLRTMCTIVGAGTRHDFFRIDWKEQRWNLMFIAGAVLGGFLAFFIFPNPDPVEISAATITWLESLGVTPPAATGSSSSYVPPELFATDQIFTVRGLVSLVGGGLLIGFGTRWAGGCTSGHAISGLSNLQLPSLIAVVGFFLGGLLMSWIFLPFILSL
jgi:uncharacterized membrane protein YedE/YeeE